MEQKATEQLNEDAELMDFATGFCNPPMTVFVEKPKISMTLYETEADILERFLETMHIESEISKHYLILYNFASDCRYAEEIQPQLIQYLLPFYMKCAKEAVLFDNEIAMTIYTELNTAMLANRERFIKAVGTQNYQDIMNFYIELVLVNMSGKKDGLLSWVSCFNTTIALAEENIERIFFKIFHGAGEVKYAFMAYLSVLLFKEGDNLLATEMEQDFWSNAMWNYDGDCYKMEFFWSEAVVDFYKKHVTQQQVEKLYEEVEPLLRKKHGKEIPELIRTEMNHSFQSGVFDKRKEEFLKKTRLASDGYVCWDTAH